MSGTITLKNNKMTYTNLNAGCSVVNGASQEEMSSMNNIFN
jgi:hypothetical protein